MTNKIEIQGGEELTEFAKDIAKAIRGEEFGEDLEREIKHVITLETFVQLVIDKAESLGYDFTDYDEDDDDDGFEEDDDNFDDDEDEPEDEDDDEDEDLGASMRDAFGDVECERLDRE